MSGSTDGSAVSFSLGRAAGSPYWRVSGTQGRRESVADVMQLALELHLCGGALADVDVRCSVALGPSLMCLGPACCACCMHPLAPACICLLRFSVSSCLYEGCAVYIACLHAGRQRACSTVRCCGFAACTRDFANLQAWQLCTPRLWRWRHGPAGLHSQIGSRVDA